jgi:hypothetical protein
MGRAFQPVRSLCEPMSPSVDHNLNLDRAAAVPRPQRRPPLLNVPVDVTMSPFVTNRQLKRLRSGDPLCQALARLIDRWTPFMRAVGTLLPRAGGGAWRSPSRTTTVTSAPS